MNHILDIYTFDDYRPFLRQYLRSLPGKGRGEIGKLARHIAINISVLSLVLKGDRDLTPEHALEVSDYFAWPTHMKEYFCLLNQFQRAGSFKLKTNLKAKIQIMRKQARDLSTQVTRDVIFSDEQKSVFYSHFAYSAIRMLSSFTEGISLDELETQLKLSRAQLVEMLRFLVENKLVVEINGRFFIGPQATHLEKKSLHFKQNHTNWRIQGIQKIDRQSERDFFYTAPFAISEKDFSVFRDELSQLIKKFVGIAKDSDADQVGCLSIDFFAITDS